MYLSTTWIYLDSSVIADLSVLYTWKSSKVTKILCFVTPEVVLSNLHICEKTSATVWNVYIKNISFSIMNLGFSIHEYSFWAS